MPDYAPLDRQTSPTQAPDTSSMAPTIQAAPTPGNSALQCAVPGVSDAQRELDQAAAAEAGMTDTHVATLASFGLRPSEMDRATAA